MNDRIFPKYKAIVRLIVGTYLNSSVTNFMLYPISFFTFKMRQTQGYKLLITKGGQKAYNSTDQGIFPKSFIQHIDFLW